MTDDREDTRPGLPAALGSTGRAEAMDPSGGPAPGSHWRAREDVAALRDQRADDGWGFERRRAVSAGTVLLVSSLKFVDGALHAVETAAHPLDGDQSPRRFLAEEFSLLFEHAPDAQEVRAREQAELSARIAAISAEIASGPGGAGLLPAPSSSGPDLGALIAARDRTDEVKDAVVARAEQAQRLAAWTGERVSEIRNLAEVQVRFYTEVAKAASASAEAHVAQAARLTQGVRTLDLFTGKGVEVVEVLDGDPADPSEPLTIYQLRLYLDEEMAVHLDGEGLSFADVSRLPDLFEKSPGLLDRLLPAPRSVALVRLRRDPRRSSEDAVGSFADLLRQSAEARLDMQSFLAVRNGGRLRFVWSDHVWSGRDRRDSLDAMDMKRLFPSRADAEKPFKGFDGRTITPRDLDYSDARERLDDGSLAYRRLLVAMWGLHERTDLFGEFYDRDLFGTWLDPEFQASRFRFVEDEAMALPDARAPVDDWIAEMNARLQPGSRVTVEWDRVADGDSAPAWHSSRYDREGNLVRTHLPAARVETLVSASSSGRTVVRGQGVRRGDRAAKAALVDLGLVASRRSRWPGFLVLDAARLEDVERYVESRRDREAYLSYLELLIEARRVLRADRAAQRGVEVALSGALVEGHPEIAPARALDHAREAIRLWVARNRGAPFPAEGAGGRDGAFRSALSVTFALAGLDALAPLGAEAFCASEGREPLRLGVDGNGDLVLHATPTEAERLDHIGERLWAWRCVLDRSSKALRAKSPSFVGLDARTGAEATLREWPEAARWTGRKAPGGATRAQLEEALEAVGEGAAEVARWRDGVGDPGWFDEAVAQVGRLSARNEVHRGVATAALALTWRGDEPGVVIAQADMLAIYARSSASAEMRVCMMFEEMYAQPEPNAERLRAMTAAPLMPRVTWVDLAHWKAARDAFWHGGTLFEGGSPIPSDWREALAAHSRKGRSLFGGSVDLPAAPTGSPWTILLPEATAELLDAMSGALPAVGPST